MEGVQCTLPLFHSSNLLTVSVVRFFNMGTSFLVGLVIPAPPESHQYLPIIQPRSRLGP